MKLPDPDMKRRPLIEVGVYCIESALAAQQGGADRVELCANLPEGGVSPSAGVIEVARRCLDIGLWVMVRPRPYDFCYSDHEFQAMLADIQAARRLGADGVVVGMLTADGQVDRLRLRQLMQAAGPMQVTFHRAFDVARDLPEALETLIEAGVHRVLTTGGHDDPIQGMYMLERLIQQSAGRIGVMVGRTDETTIAQVIAGCGAREIHINARLPRQSSMRYRNQQVRMGAAPDAEYQWPVTCARRVAAAVAAARQAVEDAPRTVDQKMA